jgi:NDP-sugar pyrophosphorylase family protein
MVLAGGLGTRLREVAADRPKVLFPVGGRPFLAYLFDQLSSAGFDRAIICSGHLGEQLEEAFGGKYKGIKLDYSREMTPLGTAGALAHALPLLEADAAVVMNGDSYCDVDLLGLWQSHHTQSADATVVLVEAGDTSRYGSVRVDGAGRVTAFAEKDAERGPGWVNAGIYVIARSRLEQIPSGRPVSLERDVLPDWVSNGLCAYKTPPGTRFVDIGIPEAYAEAERFFSRQVGRG